MQSSILIVEDEPLIAQQVTICLEEAGYLVQAIAPSFEAAIVQLETKLPDLVLIDIQLDGELDGIDLANEIRNRFQLPFVFLTANTLSATVARAKLTRPAGFIVKPFQPEDLSPSIEVALYNYGQYQAPSAPAKEQDSFFLKDKHEMKRVYYADIDFAEAADNYTVLHTKKGRFMLSQTLKSVEQKLIPFGFYRIHRSFVVNVSKIDCVRPTEVIVGEKVLATSSNARQGLLQFIHTW